MSMVPSLLPTANVLGMVGWKVNDMTQACPPPIVATISPGVELERMWIVSLFLAVVEDDVSPTIEEADVVLPGLAAKMPVLQSITAPLAHPTATNTSDSFLE